MNKSIKIGLIGLGIMGKPMAKNILNGGYANLLVSDLNKASVDEVVAAGAKAATNQEIGETCDVVLTMLPNSPHVKAVMLGEGGVASFMKSGATFIDMSSINPVASKEIAAELAKKNIEMLDAPVSGGEPKAIDGTLSFMVGGKQEVLISSSPCWIPWAALWSAAAMWVRATPPSWPIRSSLPATSRLWPKP